MQEFVIAFHYDGIPYTAIVTPCMDAGPLYYAVKLESGNQDNYLEIHARPPGADRTAWEFTCPDEQQTPDSYDPRLLEEIGEAIEKKETDQPG
jgi:hypothetical protein